MAFLARGISAVWNSWGSTPPVSMAAFAASLNSGIGSFTTGVKTLAGDDTWNPQDLLVSYIYKSAAADLCASYAYSNQTALPSKLKLSVPLAVSFDYKNVREDVHERIYNFINNYNSANKDKHGSIKIKDSNGYHNLTTVNILVRGSIDYNPADPAGLEKNLEAFRAAAEKVKEEFAKVLKGAVVPEEEDEGFTKLDTELSMKANANARNKTAAIATGAPPKVQEEAAQSGLNFLITGEALNTKKTKFDNIVSALPKSDFKQDYSFKMNEIKVIAASYKAAQKTDFIISQKWSSIWKSMRGSVEYYAGMRKFAENIKVKPYGDAYLRQDIPNNGLKYVYVQKVPVNMDSKKFAKEINEFYYYSSNTREY